MASAPVPNITETPRFSIPVQERPHKRLHFDLDCSPESSTNFDRDVDLLLNDSSLPQHLRSIIALLLEDRKKLTAVLDRNHELTEENRFLRAENEALKKSVVLSQSTIPSRPPSSSTPLPPSATSPPLPFEDVERSRCVVVAGLAESSAAVPSTRSIHDLTCIRQIMDFLGIECYPVSIFRMGRPNASYPRLLKILLPSSFFAQLMLRRAPQLKHSIFRGIYLRPSLPKHERDRLRAERLARHGAASSAFSSQAVHQPILNPASSSVSLPNRNGSSENA